MPAHVDAHANTGARRAPRRWRAVLACCVCVALIGCSGFYNYRLAGWWLRWQIGDYVHFSQDQEALLRERLREQLRWHQRTQLPRYRAWLEQTQALIEAPPNIVRAREQLDQLRGFWTDIMVQLEPDLDRFLAALSDRQVRGLLHHLREEHSDLADEYAHLSLEKLRRERARDMRKDMERVFGALEPEQRERIRLWAEQMPDNRAAWLASRERWIDAFEQALARRADSAYFSARIHTLFVEPEQNWDNEYRLRLERNTELTLQLLADIQHSLTARQRAQAGKNARKWFGMIDELTREVY